MTSTLTLPTIDLPASTVFENLQDMNVDELMEEVGVTREQVRPFCNS